MSIENAITVEERLARIEESISALASGLNQAPTMISIATDSVDEMIQDAKESGTDVDERLRNGLKLLGRLSDSKICNALNGLLDAVEQGPGLVSMAMDSIDETLSHANQGHVKIDDRIKAVTQLVTKLSDPKMIEKVNGLIDLSNQAPGLISMAVDSLDSFMSYHGETIEDSMSFLKLENLLFLKNTGDAFIEAQHEPPAKVGGIFGIMSTLKDPDRQKALGFLMNVLKNLGKNI